MQMDGYKFAKDLIDAFSHIFFLFGLIRNGLKLKIHAFILNILLIENNKRVR